MELVSELFNTDFLIATLISVIGAILHGYTGFGAALFMVPMFTVLFGPLEAIILMNTMAIFGSMQLYVGAARTAQWDELLPVIVAVLAATPAGVYLLLSLDGETIRTAMGLFILIAATVLLSGWTYNGPRGRFPGAIVGSLAGLVNGATGVGGPPLAVYFLSAPLPPQIQRANILISVSAIVVISMLTMLAAGSLSTSALLRGIVLVPVYVTGTWLGGLLFSIGPKQYFRRVALWLLLATGIGVLVL